MALQASMVLAQPVLRLKLATMQPVKDGLLLPANVRVTLQRQCSQASGAASPGQVPFAASTRRAVHQGLLYRHASWLLLLLCTLEAKRQHT